MTAVLHDASAIAARVLANPGREAVKLSVHETIALAAAVAWPGSQLAIQADGEPIIIVPEPSTGLEQTPEENVHDC